MLIGHIRGGNPLERVVGKPLTCYSRANSRDTDMWEMPNRGTSGIALGRRTPYARMWRTESGSSHFHA